MHVANVGMQYIYIYIILYNYTFALMSAVSCSIHVVCMCLFVNCRSCIEVQYIPEIICYGVCMCIVWNCMVSGHLHSIEENLGHSDVAECSGECSPRDLCRRVYMHWLSWLQYLSTFCYSMPVSVCVCTCIQFVHTYLGIYVSTLHQYTPLCVFMKMVF